MKFNRDVAFRPFSIEIETRDEAVILFAALGAYGACHIREQMNKSYYKKVHKDLATLTTERVNAIVNGYTNGLKKCLNA